MPPLRPTDLLSLFLLLLSFAVYDAYAIGVQFVTPAAGATWLGGQNITVRWQDAGGDPDMAQLTTYTLRLVVGGTDPSTSQEIATLGGDGSIGQVSDGQVEDKIPTDVAQSVENGFYFRMTSNTSDGNQVINYSSRFTLIRMNGSTDAQYLEGAKSARGSSDVPAAQYNVLPSPAQSPSAIAPITPTVTATTIPTNDSSNDSDGPTFSTGEKVAVGIGAVMALIGVVSLFVWAYMFYRHKKRKQWPSDFPHSSARASCYGKSPFIDGKSELAAHSGDSRSISRPRSTELDPIVVRCEMPGESKPQEAARASVYEMEGEWSGWEVGTGRKSRLKSYGPIDN